MKTEYEDEARKSFTMPRFSELVFAVPLSFGTVEKEIAFSVLELHAVD